MSRIISYLDIVVETRFGILALTHSYSILPSDIMLGSSKANIYVSVAQGHDRAEEGEHHYRRGQPEWYLSLEPHKHHLPGTHKKDLEPIHYHARTDESGSYSVTTYSVRGEPEILGNILVAENVKTTANDVHNILKEKLVAGPSKIPSEQTSEDEPEHWLRKGDQDDLRRWNPH